MWKSSISGTRKGFTLVELAVVIVIIGVLAAFGVPRFLKSVERTKASEAFAYLAAVRAAQERYIAKEGVYAALVTDLDITQSAPKNFAGQDEDMNPQSTTGAPSWELTLTRNTETSSYGDYTVKFTQDGFSSASTILQGVASDISPLSGSYASGP
jgi:prepilin-type N-terminal cleavage/methylation domain-containing protein